MLGREEEVALSRAVGMGPASGSDPGGQLSAVSMALGLRDGFLQSSRHPCALVRRVRALHPE